MALLVANEWLHVVEFDPGQNCGVPVGRNSVIWVAHQLRIFILIKDFEFSLQIIGIWGWWGHETQSIVDRKIPSSGGIMSQIRKRT